MSPVDALLSAVELESVVELDVVVGVLVVVVGVFVVVVGVAVVVDGVLVVVDGVLVVDEEEEDDEEEDDEEDSSLFVLPADEIVTVEVALDPVADPAFTVPSLDPAVVESPSVELSLVVEVLDVVVATLWTLLAVASA